MAQLKTTFAGLNLNNPIIISSSGLTNTAWLKFRNWKKPEPVQ